MAPTTASSSPPNYSLFTIPAYLLLTLSPHMYSSTLLTVSGGSGSKPKTPSSASSKPTKNIYNMSNPRSSHNAASYASRVDPQVYARWERARAAHNNMLENSGFVVSAILAGVAAKCDPAYLNRMAGAYLLSRVGYTVAYVGIAGGKLSFLRTAFYMAGLGILCGLWWEAGKKIMVGDY